MTSRDSTVSGRRPTWLKTCSTRLSVIIGQRWNGTRDSPGPRMEWRRHKSFKNRFTQIKQKTDFFHVLPLDLGRNLESIMSTLTCVQKHYSPTQAGKRDYYKILGVKRTATKKEISKVRNPNKLIGHLIQLDCRPTRSWRCSGTLTSSRRRKTRRRLKRSSWILRRPRRS